VTGTGVGLVPRLDGLLRRFSRGRSVSGFGGFLRRLPCGGSVCGGINSIFRGRGMTVLRATGTATTAFPVDVAGFGFGGVDFRRSRSGLRSNTSRSASLGGLRGETVGSLSARTSAARTGPAWSGVACRSSTLSR